MARTDSFNNFLTDIATAIRTKTGGTEQIQATQFDKEIENISGGDELIVEYEITDSTTTKLVFDNLNIANDEVCYFKISGNSTIMGMSVNELKGKASVAYTTSANVLDGGTTSPKSNTLTTDYGIVGCYRNTASGTGTLYVHKKSKGVHAAGLGDASYVIGSGFNLEDEILTKITLYAKYNDIDGTFTNGTKIQLYKQAKV